MGGWRGGPESVLTTHRTKLGGAAAGGFLQSSAAARGSPRLQTLAHPNLKLYEHSEYSQHSS